MIESGDGWFVADQHGVAQGPLTRAELQSMRETGRIGDDHLVWTLRESEWVPLRRALGLQSTASSAQPAPRPPVSKPTSRAPDAKAPKAGKAPLPGTAPVRPADDWRLVVGKQPPAAVAEALLSAGKTAELAEKRERAVQGVRRLLARSIDLTLLGGIGWALLAMIGLRSGLWELNNPRVELQGFAMLVPALLVLAALPLEAVMVGLSGYTPGRWLLGLRVVDRHGTAPGVTIGFHRATRVALIGQAFLIFPFSLIAYGVAFGSLLTSGRTHWDKALDLHIRTAPLSPNQWWIALVALGISSALWVDGLWMRLAYELMVRM